MLRHKNVLDYLSGEYSYAPLPNSSHTHSLHTLTHPSSRPTTRIPSSSDITILVTPVLANAADSRRASSKSATRNRPRKRFLCRPHSVLYHQAPPKSQCPSSTPTNASFGTLSEYPGVLTYRVTCQGHSEVCRCFRSSLLPTCDRLFQIFPPPSPSGDTIFSNSSMRTRLLLPSD